MFIKFEEWLVDQQYREDLIGDLARILSTHKHEYIISRHKPDEHKNWVDIVIGIAEPGYVPVFNDAWQEYVLAKQSVEDTLE